MTRHALAAVLALAASGWAAPALAKPLTIVNATPNTMMRFYAAPEGDARGADVLGDRVLRPGQAARVEVDNGDGTCRFTFTAEFDNGQKVVRPAVDICQLATYRVGVN